MRPVAVIGGGITGLTAAFYLKRKGIPVTLYESSARVGGVIQSIRRDGYLAEFGPNTILETSPKIGQLIRDVGLERRKLSPDPQAEARYVVRDGQPVEMPASPLGFFKTNLFSVKAKLALLREPFVKARRDGVEESIAQFTVRRFNQEFLDHAIDALVAGIYAGDPQKLSVVHAFPRLKALEDNYGSMIKGQIFGARERKKRGEISKDRAPKFSFDEGLQVLTTALSTDLDRAVTLTTSVAKVAKADGGFVLGLREKDGQMQVEHSAVVYCGTAYKLADLALEAAAGVPSLQPLSGIRHPPVASVVLGFKREDVRHPCQGFGMLIPKIEGFKILGTIFSSSLFPNRAPEGHLTLTTYVGGERYPELAGLPTADLYKLVCEDLKTLLGVQGAPTFQHCCVYPRSIPQYNVGYGRFKELMTELESRVPGFFLAGHYRDGISLSDSILSGINAAERVEKALNPRQT